MSKTMKKASLLLVLLLALTACNSHQITYNKFTFSYPDSYILDDVEKYADQRYYTMVKEDDPLNFVHVDVMPDYIAQCGATDPTNLDICQHMLLLIDDLANFYFFEDEDVQPDEDFGFTIKTPESEEDIPNATAELRGTRYSRPFRAYFAADLWGDNMVVTLMCASDDNEFKKQIQEFFQTYEWHE
jgi:hypothetical protein